MPRLRGRGPRWLIAGGLWDERRMLGVILALATAIFFALSAITARAGLEKTNTLLGTAINVFVGTLIVLLVLLGSGEARSLAGAKLSSLGWFAAAGVVHFFLGWAFRNASIQKIGAARAQTLAGTNPLVAVLLAVVVLGENLSPSLVLGVLLIVLGAYLISVSGEA